MHRARRTPPTYSAKESGSLDAARVALEDVDELEQDVRLHVHLLKTTAREAKAIVQLCHGHDHDHDHGRGREVGLRLYQT
ncbi:hypothetical protein QYE76_070669 [Lolium multiflorum]|uniref:Uncharacterized protein n=1 Tax=Lolium multiflorum TaxID=4521 RepID=A0AAD8WG32_LOLMU|nr:hypothetical protein QYE76_070669 [Lolium multiflorum]